jgi:hypothetical protein
LLLVRTASDGRLLGDASIHGRTTALNDLVEQVADAEEGSRVKRAATPDGAHADADRATAALDQQSATTPASYPTHTPGSG